MKKVTRMLRGLRLFSILFLAFLLLGNSVKVFAATNRVSTSSISATQTGTVTYGTSSSATYTITLNCTGGAPTAGSSVLSMSGTALPTGATAAFSSGSYTVAGSTVTLPSGSASGTVILTITSSVTTPAATTSSISVTTTLNASTTNTFSFVVSPKALTVTANAQNKTYGTTQSTPVAGSTAFTSSGLVGAQTIGSVTLTYAAGGIAANSAVGSTSVITPSAATGGTFTASNYTITYVTGTLTVTAAALTVTGGVSKVYGSTLANGAGSNAFTSVGLQNGETIGSVTSTFGTGAAATDAVGAYATQVTPSLATGGTFTASNYTITYAAGTLIVTTAILTITADNVNKTYGTLISSPGAGQTTFTSSGLQNGETIGTISIAYGAGSAANSAVGSFATVTPSAATGGTFTASNYSITYSNGNIIVGAAALTITANAQNKTYGTTQATPVAGSAAFTSSALQNGETIGTVTLTYGAGGLAGTSEVGSTSVITPSAATGGTFTASNYTITYVTGTLTVTAAALTITGAVSKVFGATLTDGAGSTAFTSVGLQNGETIGSVTSAFGTGAAAADAVGAYANQVTPSLATGGTFTASNYTITYAAGTLTVTGVPLTITADNVNKTYGTLISSPGAGQTTFTSIGLQNGETIGTVSIAYGAGSAANAAVGTYNNVTPSAATGGTFIASNYAITYVNGDIIVGAAALTITADAQNKTYGTTQATPVAGSAAFTSSALQNGETIGTVTLTYGAGGLTAASTVGSTSVITPSAATGGTFTASNYTITYVTGTLTVTAAALTITGVVSKAYGSTLSDGAGSTAFTSVGLQNGETIGSVTSTFGTGAAATDAVGAYATQVTPSLATGGTFTASNYTITYAAGTLTVTARALTVTANDVNKTYGTLISSPGAGQTTFTSSGLQNGETIGTISIAYGVGAAANAAVGSYANVTPSAATGGTFTASNYTITYTNGNIIVAAKALTVTANAQNKTYGTTQATPVAGSTAFTSSGLVGAETIGSVTLTYAAGGLLATSTVGSTSVITPSAATGGTFTASNYTITYATGTLTVTAAALTITANNQTKCFGQTFTFAGTEFTTAGLVNSDAVTSATLTSAGSGSGAAVGSYSIVPSAAVGTGLSNYTITYTNGTMTVNALSTDPTSATASSTTICNGSSTTLTLNGGGGGTSTVIKWYTVSCGGTLAGTGNGLSVSPTTTTTYYGRYEDPAPCSANTTCATVTITVNPIPTITLGSNPSLCTGTTTANLTYSATTGSPDKYSIVYDATAIAAGFANVTLAALPASPIVLVVPSTAAGIFNYTVTVTNSSTGCVSSGNAKTVTVGTSITLGTNAFVISGETSANLTYSATTGSPDKYSIVYDAAAITAGFANVTLAALPASPIVLVVPTAAAIAIYNYTITVTNSTSGCVSSGYAKTVRITSGVYYSQGNVAPNNLNNWTDDRAGLGANPVNFTTANNLFVIQTTNLMQMAGNWTLGTDVNLEIENGSLKPAAFALSIGGTTLIDAAGAFEDLANNGVNTFTGLVTNNGTWTSTNVSTTGNLIFQSGIINNNSFSAGGATFNTNNQSINGTTALSFANVVTVTGVTVTNNNTVSITANAAAQLTGTGTWTQGTNSTLIYGGTTITITALNASASGNTVNYNNTAADQTIFNPVSNIYFHLTLDNTSGTARTKTLSAAADINGNLTISATANTGNTIFSASTFDITLAGNWINNSTNATAFTPGTRKVTFDGTVDQNITGSAATTFYDLTMNNTGTSTNDDIILGKPTTVSNGLILVDGIINTTATNILTLTNTATTASTSGNSSGPSFVSGPMTWSVTSTASTYVFPTGKGSTKWAMIGVVAPNAAGAFTCEYFNATPPDNTTLVAYPTAQYLRYVSNVEYWDAARTSGAATAKIKLFWESNIASGITTCSNLMVAHYTSGKWQNEGTEGCSYGATGSITGANVLSTFSPFTFGDSVIFNPAVNPLPIELLSFNAKANGNVVNLNWATASEINNDFFTIEKTIDGVNFETIETVKGAGNNTSVLNYASVDNIPYDGVSYYRLKQTDFDGNFTYSELQMVSFEKDVDFSFNIYPNPTNGEIFNLQLTANKNDEVLFVVHDMLGIEMCSKILIASENNNVHTIEPSQKLPTGVYLITATSNQKIYNKRLIVN